MKIFTIIGGRCNDGPAVLSVRYVDGFMLTITDVDLDSCWEQAKKEGEHANELHEDTPR